MMENLSSFLSYGLLALVPLCILLAGNLFMPKMDPKEPSLVTPMIPFIGHLIGLMRKRSQYYVDLRKKTGLPIYTLSIFGGRMYIVNSLELTVAVQRQGKALDFFALFTNLVGPMTGASPAAQQLCVQGLQPTAEGGPGFSKQYFNVNHTLMAPGKDLDTMNRVAANGVKRALDTLDKERLQGPVKFFPWIVHEITMASFESTHGPHHLMRDREIEDAFWAWEQNLIYFFMGDSVSRTLASHAFACRNRVARAMEKYFRSGNLKEAAPVFRARHDIPVNGGISERDIGNLEIGAILAIASNTGPTSFWALYHIYSDPGLLAQLRKDLSGAVTEAGSPDGGTETVYTFDFGVAKSKCPLLPCVFQETLRHHGTGTSVREVMEDTLLAGRYLLKKGGVVQLPAKVIHSDPTIWGADVDTFRPSRFLGRQQPGSFRGFGGGNSLCPGRHFAMNEILVMLSLTVLRFDLRPVGGGPWPKLMHARENMTTAVAWPREELLLDVVPRKGFEDAVWSFELTESKRSFELSAVA